MPSTPNTRGTDVISGREVEDQLERSSEKLSQSKRGAEGQNKCKDGGEENAARQAPTEPVAFFASALAEFNPKAQPLAEVLRTLSALPGRRHC